MKISILLPTYNGSKYILPTIKSLLTQNYSDYEIILHDDNSTDDTIKKIAQLKNSRIKIYKNRINLGYPKNLELARKRASGEIIFLMGQDDILKQGTLKKINTIFSTNIKIQAISRPYYWFEGNPSVPNRAKPTTKTNSDLIIDIHSPIDDIILLLDSLDQLSSIAFRVKTFQRSFHIDVFPCHIYPFVRSLISGQVYFMADYTVAVRTESSQTRFRKDIYNKSPLLSWIEMIDQLFFKYPKIKKQIIEKFVTKNYFGLFQIKNYGTYKQFMKESWLLLYLNPTNMLVPTFWLIFLILAILPRSLTIKMVYLYKNIFLKHKYKNIPLITYE